MIKYILSVLTLVAGIENSICQIGIGTTSPDISSVLDVSVENKGDISTPINNRPKKRDCHPSKRTYVI